MQAASLPSMGADNSSIPWSKLKHIWRRRQNFKNAESPQGSKEID
jgi:hypothetical protein